MDFLAGKLGYEYIITFSRLNTLCTPLVWMRIAAVATLYTTSGYVIKCSKCRKCSQQNFVHGLRNGKSPRPELTLNFL